MVSSQSQYEQTSILKSIGFIFLNLTSCNRSMQDEEFTDSTNSTYEKAELMTRANFNIEFTQVKLNILYVWELLSFGVVLMVQISFIFFESGSVSTKTTQSVLNKSTFVFVVAAITFYCFGFGFANEAYGGFIGTQYFFAQNLTNTKILQILYQFSSL